MSAWAQVVNADGSDEWLELCNAALLEIQREQSRRDDAKIRRETTMAEATKTNVVRTVTEETYTLTLSADEFLYLRLLLGRQTIQAGGGANGRIYAAMTDDLVTTEVTSEPTAYTVGGVVYDLSAEYRDAADDVWFFTGEWNSAGVPLVSCRLDSEDEVREYTNWPLTALHAHYDTLTRV
ncbi:phiSA1p31-related protein [Streptomyces albidoflavus]